VAPTGCLALDLLLVTVRNKAPADGWVQVMLDTVGPELQVVNSAETPISLEENGTVVLTPHQGQEASNSLLPINFSGLAKVMVSATSHTSECPL
jgi:pyruvate kinase